MTRVPRRRRHKLGERQKCHHQHGATEVALDLDDRDDESSDNFLAQYFKEMAALSMLKPEEEFQVAQHIETIEANLWTHLLTNPRTADVVVQLVEHGLGRRVKELEALRRSAKRLRSKESASARRSYQLRCEQSAGQIYELDVDRRILFLVLGELRKLARSEGSAFRAKGVRVQVKSKAFRKYYQRAMALFASAQRVRNEFVKANLRLVVSIARRFNYGRMPLSDLIQEGNIGLIKAVERYDYRRGYRFSTYASWWIRHAISRALADKGRAVRLPVHMLDAHHKVSKTIRELSTKLGRPPTQEEIGFSTGLGLDKIERIQAYLADQTLSLDRTVSQEDDRSFIDLLSDPEEVSPADALLERAMNEQVHDIIGHLKPVEADVLRKRFGLLGEEEHTLKEIGDRYGLSRERIRQIQEQALGKIRRALQRRYVV
jgi:RNA polymerase primary sigma factor